MASVKSTSPERTDIIVQALEKGHSMTSASRLAGLHRDTLNRWMKRGRKGESGVFSHFYVTVQEALAKSEQKLVELVFNTCRLNKQYQDLNKRLAPLPSIGFEVD